MSLSPIAIPLLALSLAGAALPLHAAPAPRVATGQVDRYIQQYELVTIDTRALAARVAASQPIEIEAGLERFEIALVPNDLRAAGYRAVETLEDGSLRDLPEMAVTTFAGDVLNREGATARFTIDERGVQGLILDGAEKIFVEPLLNYSLAAGPSDYLVYRGSDVRPDVEPGTCGTTAAQRIASAVESVADEVEKQERSYTVKIATETDNEYVSALGSASAANSEIMSILNQIDGVYETEVGISFEVTLQNTYSGSDPYSATNPIAMLEELRDRWNARMTGVRRDLVHLWTGRDVDGATVGVAYIGVVCTTPTYAYGITQRYQSAPQKFILTAHEIGHNFNACHSDSECNPNRISCSNTIMQTSSGNGLTFCDFSREEISKYLRANGSCLSTAKPTPPAAPSRLAASAISSSRIELVWDDNSENETGFKLERRTATSSTWSTAATAGVGETTHVDTSLAAGTTYVYRARATGLAGDSGYTDEVTVRTPSPNAPAAPGGLEAEGVSKKQIDLRWTDRSSNEAGFRIERSADGVRFEEIATVGADETSYSSTKLKKNREYLYRVRAFAGDDVSLYSNTASARTLRHQSRSR